MTIRRLCPLCVQNVRLRNDGTYYTHNVSNGRYASRCFGSKLTQQQAHKVLLDRRKTA